MGKSSGMVLFPPLAVSCKFLGQPFLGFKQCHDVDWAKELLRTMLWMTLWGRVDHAASACAPYAQRALPSVLLPQGRAVQHQQGKPAILTAEEWHDHFGGSSRYVNVCDLPGVSGLNVNPDVMHCKWLGTDSYLLGSNRASGHHSCIQADNTPRETKNNQSSDSARPKCALWQSWRTFGCSSFGSATPTKTWTKCSASRVEQIQPGTVCVITRTSLDANRTRQTETPHCAHI